MISEAIILAGGLGTRLRSVVPELPKCMAPVADRPFLDYVIEYLQKQGIRKFIFALGYKSEIIERFLKSGLAASGYQLSIEHEPLGTGGAIRLAAAQATAASVLVLNGDTFFDIDVRELAAFHESHAADCSLSLKPMHDFDRYGVVELGKDHTVKNFHEKKRYASGLINGGVYALSVEQFIKEDLPPVFSFEKDYLEKYYTRRRILGLVQDRYFIDIGIPEDYERAQTELPLAIIRDNHSGLDLRRVDRSWTLFLDRDGVMNYEKPGDYVYNWNEFIFYEGVPEAIKILGEIFGLTIMVTNQRGIGKGLMTEQDLQSIHGNMLQTIEAAGGRIDRIYYCPSATDDDPFRKPNPGMAFLAKKDFEQIDFSRSVMVGNNISDMEFGRNAGMHTVFLKTTHPGQEFPHPAIDLVFDSLPDFAKAFQKQ